MEHRFITTSDEFVRAIAICRQKLLDCNAETIISTLMERGVKQNVEAGAPQVKIFASFERDEKFVIII